MYVVDIKYQYKYEVYNGSRTMVLRELFIVLADNQYQSIEKTNQFILEDCPTAEFTNVNSSPLETGKYGYMISGIIK